MFSSPSTNFPLREDFFISVGPNKADILRDLVMREKPKMLVELGGCLGYSAVLFAGAMVKAHGGDAGLKIYSLELDPAFATIARQIAQIAGLDHIIEVVEGTAASSIASLVKEKIITNDFKVVEASGMLKKGAVVVADNVVRPGTPEYREFIRGDMKKGQGWESWGVRGLIWPGDFEDELEVSKLVGSESDKQ
ncbi:hypothetical protein EAF00_003500 [Botryotinia globosa]|nr:hypothetical protein EAF00_003500 [Botryotinia globosa]